MRSAIINSSLEDSYPTDEGSPHLINCQTADTSALGVSLDVDQGLLEAHGKEEHD
jgi:hypothetical protein